ncbi:hypothetical protein Ga0123461_1542 [Mariprofundus aestuarium]|uniref:Uncharacterized protein n=1 Tax=Mariprofundus aestuarium TaxID=1921086 RepID=A0A2K8L6T3_MARES|nr:hypothetical protein [Mariprofundus aestuarium]ATX79956.1 hypothetical protein Ga0123461_1542 [Mariprofundus aestuarium]
MNNVTTDDKPRWLVVIAMYTAFGGVLCLVFGVPSILFDLFSLDVVMVNWVVLAIGILTLVGAYGLWKLHKWGCYLTIAIYIVSILLSLLAMSLDGSVANLMLQLVGIFFALLILIYLFGKETRALFH